MAHPQRQYKLVALDMDGTLLNRHHAISQRNRDTLLALAARGVGIAICTGRSTPCALPPLAAFQGAEHNFSLVTFNGACSYSKVVTGDGRGERNLLYSCPVPGSVTDRIFDIALQHDFVVNVYRGENIYACCRTDEHRTLCGRYQALTSCSYEYIDDRYAQFRCVLFYFMLERMQCAKLICFVV